MSASLFPPKLAKVGVVGTVSNRNFWDYEERDPHRSSRPLLGEERLWANVLIQAIQEYKGVSKHVDEECVPCHAEAHPGCFKKYSRGGDPYLLRFNKGCKEWHTIGECANTWIFSDDYEVGSFRWVCDYLGLEPDYLRANLSNSTYEEYWSNEKRVNEFLGFENSRNDALWHGDVQESHVHTGHASDPGDSD